MKKIINLFVVLTTLILATTALTYNTYPSLTYDSIRYTQDDLHVNAYVRDQHYRVQTQGYIRDKQASISWKGQYTYTPPFTYQIPITGKVTRHGHVYEDKGYLYYYPRTQKMYIRIGNKYHQQIPIR